jgi:hypothetical protein
MIDRPPSVECDRLSTIKPEDEWWFYQCGGGVPEDITGATSEIDVRAMLFHLEGIFDNKWYAKYGNIRNGGLCANSRLGGVQNTVDNIMRLASNISRLGGIAKLGKKTKDNLRNRSVAQCLDTILELEVLSCFAEEGFLVTPYPVLDSGTTPDAKIEIDKTDIFIEITHMEWPKPENFPGLNWKSKQGGKLIEKCIGKVAQLPLSQCGAIIMNPPTLIDEEIGKSIMASMKDYLSPDTYTRISGIILANKLIERSGSIKAQPIVLINVHASRRCDSELVKLASALWKHPQHL